MPKKSVTRTMVFIALCLTGLSAQAAQVTPPSDRPDRKIAADPGRSERGRSIAINPAEGQKLLAVSASWDDEVLTPPCLLHRSLDGGLTWATVGPLPQITGGACADAVVQYAPDGSRVYVATEEHSSSNGTGNTVVSVSEDNGTTWTGKVVLPSSTDGEMHTDLSLAVATFSGDPNEVWLGASGRDYDGHWMTVLVTGSTDGAATWRQPAVVQRSDLGEELYGVQISGSRGHELLVAWAASFDDRRTFGFRHEIRVARSVDGGISFAPVQVAAFEYRPWSPGEMAPDVVVGPKGVTHIVYWSREEEWDGDQGDVFYTWAPAPYSNWAEPVRINHDAPGGARAVQQSPSIALQSCGGASILHVIWTGNQLTPPNYAMSRWNLFYSRKLALPGYNWSADLKVTNAPTRYIEQRLNDIAVGRGANRTVFALWTDGRNRQNVFLDGFDVYGSRISSGVTCP